MTHRGSQRLFSTALLASIVLAAGCSGRSSGSDSPAQEVETPGTGRYERVKANVGVVVSDSSIRATIPVNVSVGQEIGVSFVKDGQEITDSWQVVRISTKGSLCRLHSAPDRTIGNTVYVKPCRVLR